MPRSVPVLLALATAATLLAGCGESAGDDTASRPTAPASASPTATASAQTGSPAPSPSGAAASGTATGEEVDVPSMSERVDSYPAARIELVSPDGGQRVEVLVRLAHTGEQRRNGLMNVEEVPEGAGMLFIFAQPRELSFWMKNTLVPLDIAYADDEAEIVSVQRMEPCEADPCDSYPSGEPAMYALEVTAGWLGEVGAEPGWRIEWEQELPEGQ